MIAQTCARASWTAGILEQLHRLGQRLFSLPDFINSRLRAFEIQLLNRRRISKPQQVYGAEQLGKLGREFGATCETPAGFNCFAVSFKQFRLYSMLDKGR